MGCDPFQMAMIHRTFRNEFGQLPHLVRTATRGDTKRSTALVKYCGNLLSVLHHHHAAEDDVLWPKLLERAPHDRSVVERAREEHLGIDRRVEAVQAAQRAWQPVADPAGADLFADAIEKLAADLDRHLDREEHDVVPVIGAHITAAEWQTFIDRGAAYVNPGNLWFALAYAETLLRDGSPDERARFVAAIPLPLRVVLRLVGRRAYDSYRSNIYGQTRKP